MYFMGNVLGETAKLTPLLVVWGTACVILLGDALVWRRARGVNALVAGVGLLIALAQAVRGVFETPEAFVLFGGTMLQDGLAGASAIILLITGLLSVLLASTYLRTRGLERAEYYVLLLLSVSGAVMMGAAGDLVMVFLGLEVLSFALYVMAGFARTDERSDEASLKYFLLGAFASAFLLYGIALVYGATQTTNLAAIHTSMQLGTAQSPMLLGGVAMILVGLGFKAAVVPFHQWTPDVYEGAPTSATAYMAGAAKVAAFITLIRVFDALVMAAPRWLPAMHVIAILTMLVGNLLAVTQTNVKRMLAYSSIAHAGYLLVAVAVAGHRLSSPEAGQAHPLALSGAIFYLFAYVFMTLGAFGVLVYLSSKGRDVQTLQDLRGLARTDRFAAYSMVLFLLSLGGIPPTMGFMGKWQIFLAAVQAREIALAVVMALASAVAIYYYLRIVWALTFEEPVRGRPADETPPRLGAFAAVALSLLATVGLGVMPGFMEPFTSLVR